MLSMKHLMRPKKGRVIGGVAAAIANYFNIPVLFVRIAWVLLLLPGGLPGLIPYFLLWMILPVEEEPQHNLNPR